MAILVMLAHANLIIDRNMFNGIFIPGWCGVDFFFILSGFLIYYSYSEKKADGVKWLKGRFTRIYPTYWIYSAVVITGHFALEKLGGGVFVSWISMDAIGIARTLLLLPTDVAVNEMPIIPTAWTLSYEIVFYLVAFAFVTHRKKLFTGITVCWITLIIMGKTFGNNGNLLLDFITSTLFLEFFMGMIVAKMSMRQAEIKNGKRYSVFVVIAGFTLLLFAWIGTNIEYTLIVNLDRIVKFGIPFAMIVYGFVTLELSRNNIEQEAEAKEKGKDDHKNVWRLLAASSYSLYLIHYPLLLILARIGGAANLPRFVTFIISAAVCILVGIIGYRIVEKPLTTRISKYWGGERSSFISVPVAVISVAMVFMVLLNPRMAVQKKLVGAFVGDSITEQGYYTRAMENKYPIKTYNYGVAGATYGKCGTEIPLLYQIADGIDVTPDFIFIAGGTNDWGNGTMLGQRGDKSAGTFYGAADILLSDLRERYPDTKIIVSTILQRDWTPSEEYPQPAGMDENQDGLSIEDFNEAIIWSAHKYGCKVIDAYGESGITADNILLYTKDGVHLNDRGGAKYADYIMTEIESYIKR